MPTDESRMDSGHEELSREARVDILIERIALHDAQADEIAKETAALGLDAKKLKAIKAAKKTLSALINEGLMPEGGVA